MSDDSFDALRAANPAIPGDPVDRDAVDRLRERVMAQTVDADAETLEVGTPQRRSSRLSWVAGAAAAAVLLAGVGGVVLGRATSGGDPAPVAVSRGAMPVINGAAANGSPGVAGAQANEAASAVAGAGRQAADSKLSAYYGWGGRTILEAGPSLSDEAGTATGYRFDSSGIDPAQLAESLATVFGVTGKVRDDGNGGYMVGSADGSSPMIYVNTGGGIVSWGYSGLPAVDCVVAEPQPADASGSAGAASPGCEPQAPGGPTPSAQEVQDTATAYLDALGVDTAALEWEAYGDDYFAGVNAWQVVDGQRTNLVWSFSFTGSTLSYANGFDSTLVPVEGYPIVGARTAVERLTDPRWGGGGMGGIYPMAADVARSSMGGSAPTTRPTGFKDGRPVVQMPVTTVIIESAALGLGQYYQPDGTVLLLPTYSLTATDGSTWSALAISEDYVDFSAP